MRGTSANVDTKSQRNNVRTSTKVHHLSPTSLIAVILLDRRAPAPYFRKPEVKIELDFAYLAHVSKTRPRRYSYSREEGAGQAAK